VNVIRRVWKAMAKAKKQREDGSIYNGKVLTLAHSRVL